MYRGALSDGDYVLTYVGTYWDGIFSKKTYTFTYNFTVDTTAPSVSLKAGGSTIASGSYTNKAITFAWFRLKYPLGKIALKIEQRGNLFVATARIHPDYKDPIDAYLSEATASRAKCDDIPSVSPREWAQTAAIGIALTYYEEPFKEQAHIHSLDGKMGEITILGETMQGKQKVYIVDYNGIRCTAIFNVFTGTYFADDKFGVIKN